MKYIKYTIFLFIFAVVFACADTQAYQQWYSYAAIEIPAFTLSWEFPNKEKYIAGNQLMYETGATEQGTGVSQPIAAAVHRNTAPVTTKEKWVSLIKGKNVTLSDSSLTGSYHLLIKVDKWVILPTYFSGTWVVEQ